ncbi:hypothetical protein BDN70DRAFT_888692, partial [Pholiota conissans]
SSARSLLFILNSLARSSMIPDARVPRHRRHPSHAGRVRVMHICGCGCLGWDERLTPYAALSVGVSPHLLRPSQCPPIPAPCHHISSRRPISTDAQLIESTSMHNRGVNLRQTM